MEKFMNKFRLDNQVAVITGASRGIGEAMAMAFAEAGARLCFQAGSRRIWSASPERSRNQG
jgi:7-alpha-hydroxysteroid dehydrogenase